MLKDQRDLLHAFNEHLVRYILVGGYALGRYTEPRVTKDMDLWVEIAEENAARVYRALAQFGAPLAGLTPKDFQDPYSGFQIGLPPNQIDIIFAASGISFEEAWDESVEGMSEEGIPVRYLSSDHFIRNKAAAGRLQDLADVAAVLASRKANEDRGK
jgi:hypothetical protein